MLLSGSLQTSTTPRSSVFQVPWRGCFFQTNRTTASGRLVIKDCNLSPNAKLLKKSLKPFVDENIQQMIIIALSIGGVTFRDFRNQQVRISQWCHV